MPTPLDVYARRLRNQKLVRSNLRSAADVVSWLGAAQSQDYGSAIWTLGLRAPGLTADDVHRAYDAGAVVRTHVMRPTWHFVTPADIRWLLQLTAPRVHRQNNSYARKSGLDAAAFLRAHKVLERALRNRTYLTRVELGVRTAEAGLPGEGQGLAYLMMNAELEGIVCSGPRRGKQFTYALLDERVPAASTRSRDEALTELTRRYFSSHGPATARDFSWWSGLTIADAKRGLEITAPAFESQVVDDVTYWGTPATRVTVPASPAAYLLPAYDEFGVAYRDRVIVSSLRRPAPIAAAVDFLQLLMIDDVVVGRWQRAVTSTSVSIDVVSFRPLSAKERRALATEADRYGTFLGVKNATVAVNT